jgi:hypothetical protein
MLPAVRAFVDRSTDVLVHDYLHAHPVMTDGHVTDRGLQAL